MVEELGRLEWCIREQSRLMRVDSRTDVVISLDVKVAVKVKMKAKSEKGDDTAVGAKTSDMSNTPRRMSYFHLQRYVYLLARIANGDAKQPYHPNLTHPPISLFQLHSSFMRVWLWCRWSLSPPRCSSGRHPHHSLWYSGTFQLAFTIQYYPHICEHKIFITTLQLVIISHTKLYLKQHEREQPWDTHTSPLHLSSTHPSTHYPRNHSYIPRHHLFRAISHPSIPPQVTPCKMPLTVSYP